MKIWEIGLVHTKKEKLWIYSLLLMSISQVTSGVPPALAFLYHVHLRYHFPRSSVTRNCLCQHYITCHIWPTNHMSNKITWPTKSCDQKRLVNIHKSTNWSILHDYDLIYRLWYGVGNLLGLWLFKKKR